MSTFTGMDIPAVQALANQMTHSAGEIQTLMNQLTNQLNSTNWVGPDHDRFINDWQSTHVPQLNQVVTALQDAATVANQNAQQQIDASNQ